MKHTITILAISRKWGGRCVAGYDHNDGRLVRLVSDEQGTQLETSYTSGINLLDVVNVDVECMCPYEHQIENICISSERVLRSTGNVNIIEKFDCLAHKDGMVFGNNRCKVADALNVGHSIEIVKFSRMSIYIEDGTTKADFHVGNTLHKWYRVTDIVHEKRQSTISNGYAVITLPPTDSYAKEHGYYKYIAAIFPIN